MYGRVECALEISAPVGFVTRVANRREWLPTVRQLIGLFWAENAEKSQVGLCAVYRRPRRFERFGPNPGAPNVSWSGKTRIRGAGNAAFRITISRNLTRR